MFVHETSCWIRYIGAGGPADASDTIRRGSQAQARASQQSSTEQIIGAAADRDIVKACLNRYRYCSKRIFEVMARMADVCEKGSLDEAYLDVSQQAVAAVAAGPYAHWLQEDESTESQGQTASVAWAGYVYCGQADGAEQIGSQAEPDATCLGDLVLFEAGKIAERIRAAVWEECGITCAAGIAHNKMLAKLASAMHKPNLQTTVLQRGVPGLFRELPLSKINGMGPKIRKRLEEHFGITEAGAALAFSEQSLAARLGTAEAKHVLRICNGIADDRVADRPDTTNFMSAKSFSKTSDLERVDHWIQVFAAELVGRIQMETRTPKTLVMVWKRADGTRDKSMAHAAKRKQTAMPPDCRKPGILLAAARALVRSIGKQLVPLHHLALVAEGMEAPDTSCSSITSFFKPVAAGPVAHAAAGDWEELESLDDGDETLWEQDDDDEAFTSDTLTGSSSSSFLSSSAALASAAGVRPAAASASALPNASQQTASDRRRANIAGGTFINAKAGMASVDKALVQDIVFEMSKGSAHYENEQRKAAITDKKIERIREILSVPLQSAAAAAMTAQIEAQVANLEAKRDLQRTYLVVDMDAFFAAVEERANPALKDIPFAVGGIGMISTANYIARRYGVRSAMPGFIAVELCKRQGVKLHFVSSSFDLYTAASKEVRVFFEELDPNYHMGSLDEAYLDITEYCQRTGKSPAAVATELRATVREQTSLTCSCGVSAVRFVAKIAADERKPDGQFILPPTREAVLNYLRDLPCRKVGGVGKVTERLLAESPLAINTMGQLLEPELRLQLKRVVSEKQWYFLVRSSLGVDSDRGDSDESSVGRKSISCERTFGNLSCPTAMASKAEEIATSLALQVAKKNLPPARTITLKLKTSDFKLHSRQTGDGGPFRDFDSIVTAVQALLTAELRDVHAATREIASTPPTTTGGAESANISAAAGSKRMEIRLMGVRLSSFEKVQPSSDGKVVGGIKAAFGRALQRAGDLKRPRLTTESFKDAGKDEQERAEERTHGQVQRETSVRRPSMVPASLAAIAAAYDCPSCGRCLTHLSVAERGRHVHNCLAAKDNKAKLDGWLESIHRPLGASFDEDASTRSATVKRKQDAKDQQDEWEVWSDDADDAIVLDQDGEEEEDDDEREETLLRRLSQSQDADQDGKRGSYLCPDSVCRMGYNASDASQSSSGSYSLCPSPLSASPAATLISPTAKSVNKDHEIHAATAAPAALNAFQPTGATAPAAAAQLIADYNGHVDTCVARDGSTVQGSGPHPVAVDALRAAADIDTHRFLDANEASVDMATFFGLPKSVQEELVRDWKWKQSQHSCSRPSPRAASRAKGTGREKRRGRTVQAPVTAFFRRNQEAACEPT